MVARMIRGFRRRCRRVAAAVALLGVAFYALLLPWHLTSQFEAQLFKAEFGPLAAVMCTSGATADPAVPGAPATNCPFCKGLASFHFALAPAVQPELPAPPTFAMAFAYSSEHLVGARVVKPRNRGPPLPT
jgi:hypothetical protein